MTIESGAQLDQYRLLEKIGEGGMGVVWKARDTTLDRDVAIKVLPEAFAQDEAFLARFEREAKAVAALSHPNIVGIFGFATAFGRPYAAMELLEGQALRELLDQGMLPPSKAVDLARQIALGLDAAHGKGIVHRDLKPDNVFVTADGRARILDFGLATAITRVESGNATSLATLPELTTPGAVLGTVGYMSPEQVRGETADWRSDIFSLGAMLYEMLSGERPFTRPTQAETMTAILREDSPEISLGDRPAPPALARLVRRCLEKSADERIQSARDLAFALDDTLLDSSRDALREDEGGASAAKRPRSPWYVARWIGVALAFWLAGWWMGRQDQQPVETWSPLTQLTDEAGAETGPALSPDGGSLAYASRAAGSWDIYVQRVGGRHPVAVAADPERNEKWPAFSPDGSLIAYNESDGDGGVWITGATGETTRRLTDFGFNPAWSPDGEQIVFVTEEALDPYAREGYNSNLWVVPASGGPPVRLSEDDAMQPAWSPSGGRIAIWRTRGGQRDLATVPLDGGEARTLLDDAPLDWSPTWSPDGEHLFFASDRGGSMGLWRLPIDEDSGEAQGPPELVAGGLEAAIALPSFSADGSRLVFRSETISINPVAIPFDPVTETGRSWRR